VVLITHLIEHHKTTRGRFIRDHLKTGQNIDLTPQGSFASSAELIADQRQRSHRRFVRSDLQRAYQDFITE